ncbi:MAG: transporter, family, beta-lactamase induction signal transducer AmpG [Candidatus Binatota bacterium]|nr:transporter, family, beta-lactamase induction signal transducer AmpG [Candidatus Binatota bacterium]
MTTRRKLAWVSILYFAEGLPFGLIVDNLPVYFRAHGVSLVDVGLLSLVGLPWSLKLLWAPLVDTTGHHRRWIAAALACMAAGMAALCTLDPSRVGVSLWLLLFAFVMASATQDIAIDGYTVALIDRGEEGVANGLRVSAYRAAMIVGGGGLVLLAYRVGWTAAFVTAAVLLLAIAVAVSALPAIPVESGPRPEWLPTFRAWLNRPGAAFVLLFVLTYKLGDASMGPMVKPFWLDRGLSVAEIGTVSNTGGIALGVAGALAGGVFTSRYGVFTGLWALGLTQALSNLGYAAAAWSEAGRAGIYAASLFESFTGGLGTAAFLAFLMRACDRELAASQYALLSALFALTRTLAGSVSGYAATRLGYAPFFALTFALSFPSYAFLPWVRRWADYSR